MHRLVAAFAIAATLATAAHAQDLPTPAAEGTGQSTQTLELVKEAVTVTIDAGGTFSTRDGEGSGNLSVDVNGVGLGIGSAEDSAPVDAAAQAGTPTTGGGVAVGSGVKAIESGKRPGPSSEADCGDDELGSPLSVAEIAQLGAGARVLLTPSCQLALITPEQRQAIADNAALTRLLAANGLTPDALKSITILRDTIVLRY